MPGSTQPVESLSAVHDLHSVIEMHAQGQCEVSETIALAVKLARADTHNAWIYVLSDAELKPMLERLDDRRDEDLPLYGVPFAIKDNIDLAGICTTAGCPEFAYVPKENAPVVDALIDAGAIPIGKTNLDQFATGLVGVRSPYGEIQNAIDREWLAGGSSSGSAVAVALGQVCFSLGTDTAGSGRVPAAFNNIYGHKPTGGWLSTRGVVPACRSLDCVSIFSRTPAEAADILAVAGVFDPKDPFARVLPTAPPPPRPEETFRFAVPDPQQLDSTLDEPYRMLFDETIAELSRMGGQPVAVDITPLLDAARLLYEGPWLAERLATHGELLRKRPQIFHPTTRAVLEGGYGHDAVDCFRANHQLAAYALEARKLFASFEFLLTPTTPRLYRRADLSDDPFIPNSILGTYTNFVNLLDLCAAAVPAGYRADGLPFGVTLIAPAGHDARLLARSAQIQVRRTQHCGARLTIPASRPPQPLGGPWVDLAVCGAHLAGEPLNHQIIDRGGVLVEKTRTAAGYRLYVLSEGTVKRPALVRGQGDAVGEKGAEIEIEIWRLPSTSIGSFLAGIAAPLGLGQIETAAGDYVTGFICEHDGFVGAVEITQFGGWRSWRESFSAE